MTRKLAAAKPNTTPEASERTEVAALRAELAEARRRESGLAEAVAAKTRALEQSLAQQEASAAVLKLISRSASDPQAFLEALIDSAVALSGSRNGMIWRYENGAMHCRAFAKGEGRAEFIAYMQAHPQPPGRGSAAARVALTGETQNIADVRADPDYSVDLLSIVQTRSALGVPMKRGDELIGAIVLSKSDPGPYPERIVALVESFADQAVIAIENSRLFGEVQARTKDLGEALAQQTATADVLKVIGRSAFDLQTVLNTLIASAHRLCNADFGAICLREGDYFHAYASSGVDGAFLAALKAKPQHIDEPSLTPRVARSGRIEHVPDRALDPDYEAPDGTEAVVRPRSLLGVPLLRDGRVEGTFVLMRIERRPFAEREIDLAQTFADQAMIAIGNVRLFDEVKARTRELEETLAQQTATADVLKVISRSVFDLDGVMQTLIDNAVRLVRGSRGTIFIRKGDALVATAFHSHVPGELRDYLKQTRWPLDGDSGMAEAARNRAVVHVPDLAKSGRPEVGEVARRAAFGAALWVPLLRDGETIGILGVPRDEPIAFSEREIELAKTFADQAVIALENARLFNETQEALQQQTATADVLKTISRSAFDLQTVLDTLVGSARALCGADSVALLLYEGGELHFAAGAGMPQRMVELNSGEPHDAAPDPLSRYVIESGHLVHSADFRADPRFADSVAVAVGGFRSGLGVPMLRDGQPLGFFGLMRFEPKAFSEREIALAQTFVDQAQIAIENARLFKEVQTRTRDLEESLAQQTATADVLKTISRSAFDLQAVLDTLVSSAARLCGGDGGIIWLRQGDKLHAGATFGYSEESTAFFKANPRGLDDKSLAPRVMRSRQTEHIPDRSLDPDFSFPGLKMPDSMLGVPLFRDDRIEGVFTLSRMRASPFSARQIELVETFADQAVIAIENARLFDEVRARTRELEASLERQTATSKILEIIASSPADAQPVFEAIATSAKAVLHGRTASVLRIVDGLVHLAAFTPVSPSADQRLIADFPQPIGNFDPSSRLKLGESAVIEDTESEASPVGVREVGRTRGYRSMLQTPIMRNGVAFGLFAVTREKPGAFADVDVRLARTFADQAVIAIENARMFNETQEALAQQTATAEVLKVISRSAFDLQKVLDTLIGSAAALGGADSGLIYIKRDGAFFVQAHFNAVPEPGFVEKLKREPQQPGRGSVGARVLATGAIVHVPDNRLDPEYDPALRAVTVSRAVLGVPLKRDGEIVGAIALARREPGLFSDRQIELAQTFADQAVIAIENARLLAEVRARTHELEQSLSDLRKTQDRLVQSEKLASLGQLTAGIAHEIKNPLNFVNNFATLSRELLEEMREALAPAPLDADARAEVDELMGMLDSNLDKVAHHGKRADSIVKNMLLHSREGSGERERVNVNAMVEEALNLGYHGARAEKPGFNVTLEKAFDAEAGEADLYMQEITRVLLNLISNGFYATAKRMQKEGAGYQPTLRAATRSLGESVEIRIRDNGSGIPADVRDKMFNPFFTTKPAGEGTGLGLSLSHDIVVKQHGGALEFETAPDAFTEFIVTLPRNGAKA